MWCWLEVGLFLWFGLKFGEGVEIAREDTEIFRL